MGEVLQPGCPSNLFGCATEHFSGVFELGTTPIRQLVSVSKKVRALFQFVAEPHNQWGGTTQQSVTESCAKPR